MVNNCNASYLVKQSLKYTVDWPYSGFKMQFNSWAASNSGVVHALNVFFGLDRTFSEGKHKEAERKERNSEIRQKELFQ